MPFHMLVRSARSVALAGTFLFATAPLEAQGAQAPVGGIGGTGKPAELVVERLGLPDFSHAGWGGAAEEPPTVTAITHTPFLVTDYGAVADDGLSDRAAVEAAIAAAEASTGPAAVVIPAGRFVLRERDDVGAPPIRVRRGDLVIRGAGMFSGGTELLVSAGSHNVYAFDIEPELDPTVSWRGFRELTRLAEIPVRGQREVTVLDASDVHPGDVVRIGPILSTGAMGAASRAMPDSVYTQFGATAPVVGTTLNFQCVYRDGVGAGGNWTDGLCVTFGE
jgi:hypothetical protein